MFATIRRYDGVDQNRSAELTRNVNQTLVPKLEKLSGFAGYWLIQDGNVFSSLSLFETSEQAKESTNVVASWIRDEKLETMIPNEPKITSGKVVAHSDRVPVAARLRGRRPGLRRRLLPCDDDCLRVPGVCVRAEAAALKDRLWAASTEFSTPTRMTRLT